MNNFRRRCSKEEMAKVYEQSKIVTNLTRDEFPPEANMRYYEGMAGGVLLVTPMPTQLTHIFLTRPRGERSLGRVRKSF